MAAVLPAQHQHEQQGRKPMEPDTASLFETVDWSCCCCSRRTGILVLGASFLFLSVAMLVVCATEASALRKSLQPTPTPPPSLLPTRPSPTAHPKMQPHPLAPLPAAAAKEEAAQRLRQGVMGLVTVQAVVAAAGALSALVLLWGVWARCANALLPWMACAAAQVALLVVGGLYCICTSMSQKLPVLGLEGFFALVVMFLFCVPVLYCLLAVGTFYRELTGSKYSECKMAATVEAQPNGIVPSSVPPPLPSVPPPVPSQPPPKPAVPPPKRIAPRPSLQRLNSEGHENPAFQSTAF